MNFQKSLLIVFASLFVVLSSCKKKSEDPGPRTFKFDNTANLNVAMTWTVNSQAAGNSYVDLDLYIDDTLSTGGTEYGSYSGSAFEATTLATSIANKSYYVGVMYYGNETAFTSPSTINWTITITPGSNTSAAQTITGTITNPSTSPNSSKVYYKYKLVKTSNGFEFIENPFEKTY